MSSDTTLDADWGVDAGEERLLLDEGGLADWLSGQFQTYPGCAGVSVQAVLRLDKPDHEGCNWSRALFLDSGGAAPENYSAAYAAIVDEARKAFNLKPLPEPGLSDTAQPWESAKPPTG